MHGTHHGIEFDGVTNAHRQRDVRAAQDLGCVGLHCPGGLSRGAWRAGLQLFEREKRGGGR